ncbi:hypothetical protein [Actinomadura madurae]|uniref:hypothetical protein n=1 Tax=Actinomadura madurae TaxID=1993 RepID=UPI0020D260D8|nr:hypothetical protein [Actinomadura madurae]MCP9947239.1 hypothetical protein [Actinomadura madurae]MCP9976478.1 hypothetical protein [Actinomadura madurae]
MTEPAAVIPTSPAEELAQLVTELCDEVTTDEQVTRYKDVNRGGGRTVKVVDPDARHRTRDVGLLDQLHAIKAARATVPVKIYQWASAHRGTDPQGWDDRCTAAREDRKCPHGQWVHVRTEHRPAGPPRCGRRRRSYPRRLTWVGP